MVAQQVRIPRDETFSKPWPILRRQILALVAIQTPSLNQVADQFDITGQAVSRHVKILSECGQNGASASIFRLRPELRFLLDVAHQIQLSSETPCAFAINQYELLEVSGFINSDRVAVCAIIGAAVLTGLSILIIFRS